MIESKLPSNTTPNIIFASSKRVREDRINHTEITEKIDIEKISNIISKLPQPKERKFFEINLRTNPKNWVRSLLNNYPQINLKEMEMLLNDFTDSMQTRMREESKYAVGMLLKNELILCHSAFGEETITPEWKAIPRMLDSDNVLRYVRFIKSNDGTIVVKYYEKWATESFVDWLGLPQKDAFYHFGGKYRIYSKIENFDIVFELTESELDSWLEAHPEIMEGKIKFTRPVDVIPLRQIWVGRKKYENVGDFIQDFIAEKYNIEFYKRKFKELVSSPLGKIDDERTTGPLELYLYKFYDEKHRVVKIEGGESVTVVEKINPNVDILFVHENIEIRNSYLDDIFIRFINGENIRLVHAGLPISSNVISIGSIEIWNKIKLTVTSEHLIEHYHKTKLQDKIIQRVFEFVIFKTLAKSNKTSHLYHFFEPFSNKILQEILQELDYNTKLTKLEDEILEFKPQDYFSGKDDIIIKNFVDDLSTKLQSSPCKVYLIGVEDSGLFNPIPSSRLKSDRIEKIRKAIEEKLGSAAVYIIPVIREEKGILILIAGVLNGG